MFCPLSSFKVVPREYTRALVKMPVPRIFQQRRNITITKQLPKLKQPNSFKFCIIVHSDLHLSIIHLPHLLPFTETPQFTIGFSHTGIWACNVTSKLFQIQAFQGLQVSPAQMWFGFGGFWAYTTENKHRTWKWTLGKGEKKHKSPIFGFHVCFPGSTHEFTPWDLKNGLFF